LTVGKRDGPALSVFVPHRLLIHGWEVSSASHNGVGRVIAISLHYILFLLSFPPLLLYKWFFLLFLLIFSTVFSFFLLFFGFLYVFVLLY
jgi:hypothetical protein